MGIVKPDTKTAAETGGADQLNSTAMNLDNTLNQI
jgi:hypothetical protein